MKIPTGGILFFDSGIGGLTVLADALPRFSEQVFLYYGDNDRAPYGNLSKREIRQNVQAVFQEIEDLGIQMAVLACNTVTAVCAEELRENCAYPIIGAEPAIMPAARGGGNVLVLATRATCASERFQKLCNKARRAYPQTSLDLIACEELAGQIEKNIFQQDFDPTSYLPPVKPTSVVLGCTHYIYVKEKIEKFYACPAYDGNKGIAMRICSVLDKNKPKNAKGRDERPLKTPPLNFEYSGDVFIRNNREICPIKRTYGENFQENAACKAYSDCFIMDRKGNAIFFLGKQKFHNKHIFEQMFVKCRK